MSSVRYQCSLEILQLIHVCLIGVSRQAQVQEVLRNLVLVVKVKVLEHAAKYIHTLLLKFIEQVVFAYRFWLASLVKDSVAIDLIVDCI